MRIRIWLILFISYSLSLSAEEPDSLLSRLVMLDEVVVQSFKHDKHFRMAPLAASTVNGSAIRNRNITGIKGLSSYIPNLFIPDYGSKLTSPVYIRGIGSRINAPSVGLYVDGIPYFEKSAFDFDFNEIDHIEILRGPQGTLYGRNTMGGIINVYNRSALKYKGTNLYGSFGNYNNVKGAFSHYGKLSGTLGYAISGNYTHAGGYFDNVYNGKKADKLKEGSGRIRLEWATRQDLRMQLVSSLDYTDQGGYPYALTDSITHRPGRVNYNDYSSYKRTLSTTGLTVHYTTGSFSLNSQSSFQYLSDKQGLDQDFSTENLYFAIQNQQQHMVSQEFSIKSAGENRYKWLFGVFGFWQGINNEVILQYKANEYETRKLYNTPTYGAALYHQSTIEDVLLENLSLTLGMRYDYEKADTDYKAYKNTANDRAETDRFTSKLDFNQFTPKIAIQYSIPSRGMIYATVSKGYKTGGFNTSFEKEEDRSFKPEYSWNYEAGTKWEFLENRIKAELSLFYIDWKNQQIYQPLPSGRGSMLKNAGRSESKGIEIGLQGNLFNGFMLQANYGYTHATFKAYKRSETLDYAGNYLPIVPSQTISASADYMIPSLFRWIDRFSLNIGFVGTGKLYWNENNKVSQPFYAQLNGKISATKEIVTISLWAKNMTNTKYTAFYFESMGEGFAQKGRPFTFGTDIAVNF